MHLDEAEGYSAAISMDPFLSRGSWILSIGSWQVCDAVLMHVKHQPNLENTTSGQGDWLLCTPRAPISVILAFTLVWLDPSCFACSVCGRLCVCNSIYVSDFNPLKSCRHCEATSNMVLPPMNLSHVHPWNLEADLLLKYVCHLAAMQIRRWQGRPIITVQIKTDERRGKSCSTCPCLA